VQLPFPYYQFNFQNKIFILRIYLLFYSFFRIFSLFFSVIMARSTTTSNVFPNDKTNGLIVNGTLGFSLCKPFMGMSHLGQIAFPSKQGKKIGHAYNFTHTN